MTRFLLTILTLLVLTSCAKDRAQFAADQGARHEAIQLNLDEAKAQLTDLKQTLIGKPEVKQPEPADIVASIDKILAPLGNASKLNGTAAASVPAIAEATPRELSKLTPAHSARDLKQHPEIDAPAKTPGWSWREVAGVAGSVGLGVILVLNKVGPLLPYVGPLFESFKPLQPIVDALWKVASHRNEVQADKAKTVVADGAADLLTLASAVPITANSAPTVAALQKLANP